MSADGIDHARKERERRREAAEKAAALALAQCLRTIAELIEASA